VNTREEALRELVRGRLELTGPSTLAELNAALGLPDSDLEIALGILEAEGFVLRGRYRPERGVDEWCERRLLARIHRSTLDKLRREIDPVSPAVLMRFFALHQHASVETRQGGAAGLAQVVRVLSGFPLAACAWERDVLPLRVARYEPELLDRLCFSGQVVWAGAQRGPQRIEGPVRTTPIALYPRAELAARVPTSGSAQAVPDRTRAAERVHAALARCGASFVSDLARESGLEPGHVQEALGELIGAGLVTSDGFSGLRALIESGPRSRLHADAAGRYALLRPSETRHETAHEQLARTLLARWGVIFRRLLERESDCAPWRELLPVLRQMEARGDVRGGRFVANFGGEQFALPEAVSLLRKLRNAPATRELLTICASDPLNLTGIVAPGARIPAQPSTRILLCDGTPVAFLLAGKCQWLSDVPPADHPLFEAALRSRAPGERTVQSEPDRLRWLQAAIK
jgi:ATP-dependent Lhr-like helicase